MLVAVVAVVAVAAFPVVSASIDAGNLALFNVPLPILEALVVSVVADAASEEVSALASICVCTLPVTVLRCWNSVFVTEPSAILVASIAADAFMLASSIFVISFPVPSASIVLFVRVSVADDDE